MDENFGGKWLFGRLAFWIAGERIGDYDAGTSLTDVLGRVGGVIKYSGRRPAPALASLPPDAAFDLIDKAVYGRDDGEFDTYVDNELLTAAPGTLCLTPSVDVFDRCQAYTFEFDDFEKILFKVSLDSKVRSICLPRGHLAAVTRPFYDWLDDLYEQHVVRR